MLNSKGTDGFEGSRKATVTISRFSSTRASITLMYIFSNGLVNRCTISTPSAARLIRNWRGRGRERGREREREREGVNCGGESECVGLTRASEGRRLMKKPMKTKGSLLQMSQPPHQWCFGRSPFVSTSAYCWKR